MRYARTGVGSGWIYNLVPRLMLPATHLPAQATLRRGAQRLALTLLALALLVAAVAVASHAETSWLRSMRHGIAVVRHSAGSSVARTTFVVAYTLLLTIGLPGGPLMILGGAAFGPILGSILSLSSITVGAAAGYWLARLLGERFPRRVLAIHPPHNFTTLISLQINPLIPNSILNLGAGLARVDFRTYMASVVIGNAAPTIAYSYFAGALLSAGGTVGGVGRELWISGVVLAAILLAPVFASRWRTT
jgi:uncharacterized membrane protein YdjX (TVP38/TMEM64 family)